VATGRDRFTKDEADRIQGLLLEIRGTDRGAQKGLRAQLRGLGFRISDWRAGTDGFTASDFDRLVESGEVMISGDGSDQRGKPVVDLEGPSRAGRIRGCFLGGALGDALGAPVEFLDGNEILGRVGPRGVRSFLESDGNGRITDDTQMTLFTAEGMIRSRVRAEEKGICHEASVIDHAYARWLLTQGEASQRWPDPPDGWLATFPELQVSRAPGNTCLAGLRSPKAGTIEEPLNESKGCGALMRAAPVGMVPGWSADRRFRIGAEVGALTHGHPTGYLASGFLAAAIGGLIDRIEIHSAVAIALDELREQRGHEELKTAVEEAIEGARRHGLPSREQIEGLGGGWVAEEALTIALWVALAGADPFDALSAAVTHGGDSDSTGAIAGNLIGAALGDASLPRGLVKDLAEDDLVTTVADDVYRLLASPTLNVTEAVWKRYPGW
jgi:ADP-ribosylglycohydrolase